MDTHPEAPQHWEAACREAIIELLSWQEGYKTTQPDDEKARSYLRYCLDTAVKHIQEDDLSKVDPDLLRYLRGCGNSAYRILDLDGVAPTVDWMVDKLALKQRRYGPNNILKFGMIGLVIRTSDKVERIEHMVANGVTASDESEFDSLFDIVGYATLGIMLDRGTFTLPLFEDTPERAMARAAMARAAENAAKAVGEAMAVEAERYNKWRKRVRASVPAGMVVPDEWIDQVARDLLDLDPDDPTIVFDWHEA